MRADIQTGLLSRPLARCIPNIRPKDKKDDNGGGCKAFDIPSLF
jgi:hypothetical protein